MEHGFLNTFGMWEYFLPQGAPKLNWLTMKGIAKRGGIVLKKSRYQCKGCRIFGPACLGLPGL